MRAKVRPASTCASWAAAGQLVGISSRPATYVSRSIVATSGENVAANSSADSEIVKSAENSPHLEIFRKKGIEVLLMSDRIDEWVMGYFNEFDGKKLRSIAKGDVDLGSEDEKKEAKEQEKAVYQLTK